MHFNTEATAHFNEMLMILGMQFFCKNEGLNSQIKYLIETFNYRHKIGCNRARLMFVLQQIVNYNVFIWIVTNMVSTVNI